MNWGSTLTRTVDLGYEQMLLLESRPQTSIRVIYGGIWLTEEGRPDDVFARGGDEVQLKSHGLAVVEGLGYARVQVMEPRVSWRGWLAALERKLSAFVARVQARLSSSRRRPQTV
jgi:hypothetical protein